MLAFDSSFFDDSRWPRLLLRLPGTLSASGHDRCLAALGDYLRRNQRFVFIVDLTQVGLVSLEQRWRQVEWFEEYEALLRTNVVATAAILTSPLVRLSISAILHFKRLPQPFTVVANQAMADAWADEQLREAGLLPLPDPGA